VICGEAVKAVTEKRINSKGSFMHIIDAVFQNFHNAESGFKI
jgi:hypothetical protein